MNIIRHPMFSITLAALAISVVAHSQRVRRMEPSEIVRHATDECGLCRSKAKAKS